MYLRQAAKTKEIHVCVCNVCVCNVCVCVCVCVCLCVCVSASVCTCCCERAEELNHSWHHRLPGQTVLLSCTAERIHLHALDVSTCLDGIRVWHKVGQPWRKVKGHSKFEIWTLTDTHTGNKLVNSSSCLCFVGLIHHFTFLMCHSGINCTNGFVPDLTWIFFSQWVRPVQQMNNLEWVY